MTDRHTRSLSSNPLPRALKRACNAIRAEPRHAWTLSRLAAVAGVSSRTLQRQCNVFRGQSLRALLRDIRLECARSMLIGSPCGVAEVAQSCGFAHLSRFAAAYRDRYGEAPSQTVTRRVHLLAAQASTAMHASFAGDRPIVAVLAIEVREHLRAIAQGIGESVSVSLGRAGVAVTTRADRARYQLSGMLREEAGRRRLTLRLSDVESGRYVWAHRWDEVSSSAFTFEERVALQVAGAVRPSLQAAETDRARRKVSTDLTAYDLACRAMPDVMALDSEGHARALDALGLAQQRDPGSALVTALFAWCQAQGSVYQFSDRPTEACEHALELARRALTLEGADATVLAILGNAFNLAQDLKTAEIVTARALSLDGSSSWAWSRGAWLDVYSGRPQSAIERFAIALDLAPHDPVAFNSYAGLGCANFHVGRYDESARWQERAVAARPSAAWLHRTLCPAYVLGGQKQLGRLSLDALRPRYPDITATSVAKAMPFPRNFLDRLADGLEAAGLPP